MTTKFYITSLLSLFFSLISLNIINAQHNDDIQFVETRDVGTGVFLKWEMPDEDVDQFFLERATAGNEFEVVESFTTSDEDEKNTFSFFDNALGIQKMKYRIRCVSADQGSFYSKVIPMEKKVKSIYRVASKELINEGYFKVTLEAVAEGELDFSLRDEFGEKVITKTWSVSNGLNEFFIDLDDIPDGAYSGLIRGGQQANAINFAKKSRSETGVALKKN